MCNCLIVTIWMVSAVLFLAVLVVSAIDIYPSVKTLSVAVKGMFNATMRPGIELVLDLLHAREACAWVIPRYQTMKGHKVNRVFGWDTHGLPAELEAQKELGIDS